MGAFHAYDIRGIYNEDFTKEDVYKIGYFLPRLLTADKVMVGRDVRVSSPEIFEYLCKGITDAGADVYNIGLSTTPMVYYSTARYKFDASVMITASHNSREYNGLKVSRSGALPVGYDTGLGELKRMMEEEEVIVYGMKGKVVEFNVTSEYINFLKEYTRDFSDLKVAVDCSNGMGGLFAKKVLGKKPIYINRELDGTFPNHEPNPLVQANVAQLKEQVLENNCDLGLIFDGDADRVMFVDEKAQFISPDLMIAVLGHYFLEEKGQKAKVLQDIRTSKAVGEYLEKMGAEMHMWRVGRAFAALKLREIDGLFGGELAGHYYFKDFYYSDSGMLAALLLLGIFARFKQEGKKVSDVIAEIATYHNSGEINFKIEQKKEAMEAVKDHFANEQKPDAFYDFDGYRVEYADWWFNIRPSNTEPYLRLLAEAKTEELLNEKLEIIKSIINKFN